MFEVIALLGIIAMILAVFATGYRLGRSRVYKELAEPLPPWKRTDWNTICHLCTEDLPSDNADTVPIYLDGEGEPKGPVRVHMACLDWGGDVEDEPPLTILAHR